LVQLVEIKPDEIKPHIAGLVDYIIAQQQKVEKEGLTCEAAEFRLSVGGMRQSLALHLDIARLDGGKNNANKEYRAEDMQPTFAKGGLNGSDCVDGNPEDVWNLRKCSSANTLDVFATEFSVPGIEVILPTLLANFKHG
jgi:transportin-1